MAAPGATPAQTSLRFTFNQLWELFQHKPCVDPKTDEPPKGFDNQCAMQVGFTLERVGVSLHKYRGARCPFASNRGGMVASAQGLADWLKTKPFPGCPDAEKYTGQTIFSKIQDRTGIVFFADYWRRDPDKQARTGDHIDLWNGSRLTAFTSWFRVHLGLSWDGRMSDYRLARTALFWHIP